jgi:hypothetical protein
MGPDHHSGSVEWAALTAVFAFVTLTSSALAGREWRRAGPSGRTDEATPQGRSKTNRREGTPRTDEAQPPPRPAGGKALLRLLDLLVSAGLQDLASATIDKAVETSERETLREQAPRLVSLPARPSGARPNTSRKPRAAGSVGGKRLEAELESGPPATAQALAEATIDASRRTGQPTGTVPQWRSLGPTTIPNGRRAALALAQHRFATPSGRCADEPGRESPCRDRSPPGDGDPDQ